MTRRTHKDSEKEFRAQWKDFKIGLTVDTMVLVGLLIYMVSSGIFTPVTAVLLIILCYRVAVIRSILIISDILYFEDFMPRFRKKT